MSTSSEQPISGRDPFDEILAKYHALLDKGRPKEQVRPDFLDLFPEHAEELKRYYEDEDHTTGLLYEAPLLQGGGAGEVTGPHPVRAGSLRPGDRFGEYEIVQELGHGMGVVYQARQPRLNREVALKLIRSQAAASPADLERFLREAATVARLRHQYIVEIHESGTLEGSHYFTMPVVQGGSLAKHMPRLGARAETAAAFMAKVARGVGHAHKHVIIHRDLKPANILVGENDMPKVSDFGFAKEVGSNKHFTLPGRPVGTIPWMSPEQSRGELDLTPATDVWSLGVILYEMLTGKHPFWSGRDDETGDQIVSRINSATPPFPRCLNPALSRDLERICLKCLGKEPDLRYSTADDLAADLERYLRGEPVLARPLGRIARAGRWVRAHKTLTALCGAAAAVVLLPAGGAPWLLYLYREKAAEERRAVRNYDRAMTAIDRMLTRMADMRWRRIPQAEEERRKILEEALALLRQFLDENGDDARAGQEAGRVWRRLGDVYCLLDQHEQAEGAYRHALELQEGLVRSDPRSPNYQDDLAATWHGFALLNRTRRHFPEAEGAHLRGAAIWKGLVEAHPDAPAYLLHLGNCHSSLGNLYREWSGKGADAEQAYRAAADAHRKLVKGHPDVPEYHQALAQSLNNLGVWYMNNDRLADADATLREALSHRSHLCELDAGEPMYRDGLAESRMNLGVLQLRLDKPGDAKAFYLKANEAYEGLARDFPRVSAYAVALAKVRIDLGNYERDHGVAKDAPGWFGRAIQDLREVLGRDPGNWEARRDLRDAYMGRAEGFLVLQQNAKALDDWNQAVGMTEVAQSGPLRVGRAYTLAQMGDHAGAAADLAEGLSRGPVAPKVQYNAGCAYAVASAAARRDPRLRPAEQSRLAAEYATRATSALESLLPAGFFDAPSELQTLEQDEDFEAVRKQPEFEDLLGKIRTRLKR